MKTTAIKFTKVVNATVHVTNQNDAERKLDIAADAVIENDKLVAVANGIIQTIDDGRYLGTFNRRKDNGLNLDIPSMEEDSLAVITAIAEFNTTLKEKVDSENPLII